jgi:hypothetical protein
LGAASGAGFSIRADSKKSLIIDPIAIFLQDLPRMRDAAQFFNGALNPSAVEVVESARTGRHR